MEHTRRKFIATAVAGAAASQWSVAALAQQAYPARDLSGVIGWGAGGGTDVAMRGYAPYAEEALGRKIVLQNKAGGSGAIDIFSLFGLACTWATSSCAVFHGASGCTTRSTELATEAMLIG